MGDEYLGTSMGRGWIIGHVMTTLAPEDDTPETSRPDRARHGRQDSPLSARDITERKQAERALAQLESREREKARALDEILDRVADGFVALDRDWRYTYVNGKGASILGRRAEELVGTHVFKAFPEAFGGPFHRAFETALATQMPVFTEGFFAPWGQWFESRIYPSPTGLSVFFTDITARKLAQDAAAKARAEAEAALGRLRVIHSITDSALGHLGIDELLKELLPRLRVALTADHVTVLLLDEQRAALRPCATDGRPLELIASVRVPLGRGLSGRIAAEDRPMITDDPATWIPDEIEGLPAPSLLPLPAAAIGAPLRASGRVTGVVVASCNGPRRFTEQDLELLCLVADRVAPGIERERLLQTVRTGQERLGSLSRRLLTALEEQRRRIAAELHDELGQVLTAVKINLESLERMSGPAAAPAQLKDAIDSVDHALERVRDLALDLRPSVLDDLGLSAALRWHVDRFARQAGVEAHLSIDAVPRLAPGLETACFRVAQEALTNVARHAKARRAWIDLHLLPEALELRVRDDGVGFDVPAARLRAAGGGSMGLLGMEERVSLVGGTFELRGQLGAGTELRARFGLHQAPAGDRS